MEEAILTAMVDQLSKYDATKYTTNDFDIVQKTYADVTNFSVALSSAYEIMNSPLPESLSTGRFDSRVSVGKSFYNKLERKFRGKNRDKILEKYKKSLELAEKFYRHRNYGRDKNVQAFDVLQNKAGKGCLSHWHQIYFNNTLNQLTQISVELLNVETNFKLGAKSQEDSYEEVVRIDAKLQSMQISDPKLFATYERLSKFSNMYAKRFKQPKGKKQIDATQSKPPIQATFYDKARDRLEDSANYLHQMISDVDKMRIAKKQQDTLFENNTKELYSKMGDINSYIEHNNKFDEEKVEKLVEDFYSTATHIDQENSIDSEMNMYNSKMKNYIDKVDSTTNSFLDKSVEFAYEETTDRVKQQTQLLEQINTLFGHYNFPPECAEMFYKYLEEAKNLENNNIAEIEQMTGIDERRYPGLANALDSYAKLLRENGFEQHKQTGATKELKPTQNPTDHNGESPISG